MDFIAKTFDELTTHELYKILKARAAVFIREEKILYPDADGEDYQCVHVYSLSENGEVEAYLRMYRGEKPGDIQFGRVLTIQRKKGIGRQLMDFACRVAREKYGAEQIVLDSQKSAEGFYKKLGFETISEDFIEAGIPHVKMRKKL